ncbi:MAG: hypothetical protein Q7T12_08015 [Flavobacterium sp.]|nr:hypothetical protein [Flavobacterium sp.]
MEFKIIEQKNRGLNVYKNEDLIFYSTIKTNWLKTNLIKIFDKSGNKIIELNKTGIFTDKIRILNQNIEFTKNISEIKTLKICYGKSIQIKTSIIIFPFLKPKIFYYNNGPIGVLKENFKPKKEFTLTIEEENIEFLNPIIFYILTINTDFEN